MSKFKIEKEYHRRKLLIIELIEECDERMLKEEQFLNRTHIADFFNVCKNSRKNINRYYSIRKYLIKRYENK